MTKVTRVQKRRNNLSSATLLLHNRKNRLERLGGVVKATQLVNGSDISR